MDGLVNEHGIIGLVGAGFAALVSTLLVSTVTEQGLKNALFVLGLTCDNGQSCIRMQNT
jgi:hypothetical protein